MTGICWWLVRKLCSALEPSESEAVHGDLTESNETGAQALRDVLGLVVRRQLALWRDWRPWLVLAGVLVPLGFLVSLVSHRVTSPVVTYAWMYFSNSDWSMARHRAFWIVMAQVGALVFPELLALACLAWTIGLALGALARRTIQVSAALFFLVSLFGELVAAPWYQQLQFHALGLPPLNRGYAEPELSLTLYRAMIPLLMQIVLVWLPSIWGMYKGLGLSTFPRLLCAVLWIPAIATMFVLASAPAIFWTAIATGDLALPQRTWHLPLLPFAVAGPLLYFVATTTRNRLRRTT